MRAHASFKLTTLSTCLLLAFAPLAQPVFANPTLNGVEVQAQREALSAASVQVAKEKLNQTAGGTAVVEAENFEAGKAVTIKDMLDFTPGVFAQSRVNEEARLSIRGSGLSRTFHMRGIRLLQDGIPINLADGGSDFQDIDPLALQHVEVYKGANALQYGAASLGGAINFVTPTGYTTPNSQLRLDAGSHEFARAQFKAGDVLGDWDYFASLSQLRSDGFRQFSGQKNTRLNANAGLKVSPQLETRFYVIHGDMNQELPGNLTKAQLQSAEQDLIVRTTQAYFDVLAAQDTLTFVQAQKTAVAEQLAAAQRNFEVGTATVTDAREAQARFDLVVAQEIAAENDLRVKKLALDQLVGRSNTAPRPLVLPVSLPPLSPADPQAWLNMAGEQHPSIVQARRNLEIAQLETGKAEAGHKPTVDLVASYGTSRAPSSIQGVPGNVRTNTGSVGVQFNLPLFAGYAIQNRVKQTLALEEKARADLDSARRTVDLATRSAYFGVVSGEGQVKALQAAEASSQSALDANKLGYQVGVRINIDVLNAQSQLFQTKRDLAVARYNVLVGTLRLKQAGGVLKAEDLAAIDTLLAK